MSPVLLSLAPDPPPGFAFAESLRPGDLRGVVFALWGPSVEAVESSLPVDPALLTGLLVTPAEPRNFEPRAPGLYHLAVGPGGREEAAELATWLLALLEEIREARDGRAQAWFERDRALEDARRHAREFSDFRASLLREIGERRAAEEALRENQEWIRAVYDAVTDMILIHDPATGAILDVNRRASELLGQSRESLAGMNPEDLHPPGERQPGPGLLQGIRQATEEPQVLEWQVCSRDGERMWLEVSLRRTVIRGRPQVLAVARDITGRKAEAQERRRAELQMQHTQKLESLGVLAGGIAHDFNNLLMAIQGNLELAVADLPAESAALRPLQSVDQAARSAADLCRQILTYAGRRPLGLEAVDLGALVADTVRMLRVSISRKARLEFGLTPGIPAVLADRGQLRQILMNLAINASEALPDDGGEIRISTSLARFRRADLGGFLLGEACDEGRYVVLEVADRGRGMDDETRQRMFEPFFSTRHMGRGLGLAAVLGIVKSHRGAIQVESRPGRGTTVRLLLPPAARPAEGSAEEAPPAAPGRSPWAGRRALLAEDEELVRGLVSEMLRRQGMEVVAASDGREATRLMGKALERGERIDLALLDLKMPRMDGLEAARELKRLSPELPVILMSGYDELEMASEGAADVVDGFLQKPYRSRDLQSVMARVLGTTLGV